MRRHALTLALLHALAIAAPAFAAGDDAPADTANAPVGDDDASAETADEATTASAPTQLEEVIVRGRITYRDRTDATAPVLSYDLAYFQRFEPLTVGDMLKRVPSTAFVSDVLEYDGARLRGLDPGYTQVLINGRKVPGSGADRSFFVDRIPAELVERIEIVRSASANRSGDAVAGALNIVLRDSHEFTGSYVRAGALGYADGEPKATLGAVSSFDVGTGRLLFGINSQGRHNPKDKRSDRFEAPGEDFTDAEDQSDVRDGTDTSANLAWSADLGDRVELELSGMVVRTDRTETEHSLEYNAVDGERANLLAANDQFEAIDQRNHTASLGLTLDAGGGKTKFEFAHASFRDDVVMTEEEDSYDDEESPTVFDGREGVRERLNQRDAERNATVSHEREFGSTSLDFGVDFQAKSRRSGLAVSEAESDEEGATLTYDDFESTTSRIRERRLDPYVMLSGGGEDSSLRWETGLRYERTRATIGVDDGAAQSHDYAFLLPSAHLRWTLANDDRMSFSVARTVRRPQFDYLLPVMLEGEYGDNDFIGNPSLQPESAWGLDIGYEHRLGRRGIVGVNVFHRRIDNLVELVNTGVASAEAISDYEDDVEEFLDDNPGADETSPDYPQFDPDSYVYSAANVGQGRVWGVELDLSTPLTAWGLDHTGVFLNASWLDSRVEDAMGSRRFNDQARSVINAGFIQDVPSLGVAFGASVRKQGVAQSRRLGEECAQATVPTSKRSWRSASARTSRCASPARTCSMRARTRRSTSSTRSPTSSIATTTSSRSNRSSRGRCISSWCGTRSEEPLPGNEKGGLRAAFFFRCAEPREQHLWER